MSSRTFVLRPGGILPEGVTDEELKIRWYPQEAEALAYMRSALSVELKNRNSTVDSDSRLIRFVRKHVCDGVAAAENYRQHLIWREKESADAKHDLMIKDNLDPSTVPNGKRVTELMPQVPCSFELTDKVGNPISIEYYGFNPENVLQFTPTEYFEWFLYCYEYKLLMLEHFSLLEEEKMVAEARRTNKPLEVGWGSRAMRRLCVIRDLKGFQLSTSLTPRIPFVKELLKVSQANYPYISDHSFFTNTPWMFSVVWTILKTAISSHTKTKIHMLGSDYHDSIEKLIDNDMLPVPLQRQGTRRKVVIPVEQSLPSLPTEPISLPSSSPLSSQSSSSSSSVDVIQTSIHTNKQANSQTYTETISQVQDIKSSRSHGSRSPPKERKTTGFLSKLSRIKSKACSSVILSISEVEYPLDRAPPQCSRLTVRAKEATLPSDQGQASSQMIGGKIVSEDSQELQLPLTTKRFFVLSLDNKIIVDNMLTLDFELGLLANQEAVHSKLQVFIHPLIAIESLLCWVSFYDEDNQSICLLKVVLSYQPERVVPSSKFNFFSSSSLKKKKKKSMVDQIMFQAQQVMSTPPVKNSSMAAQVEEIVDDEEAVDDDVDDEVDDEVDEEVATTLQSLEEMEQQEAPIDMEANLTEMFSSFFQLDGDLKDETDPNSASWYSFDSAFDTTWSPETGTLVPLDDTSTEWAIFTCSAIDVRKFAFQSETEAREALEDWSFLANILTYHNQEVDMSGIILAPNIGRIREAIDMVRPSPLALKAMSKASSDKAQLAEDSEDADTRPADPEAGSVENVDSDWAVYTSEFFTVKRYGFDREKDAKCAMEDWMSVRMLTYQEEEVLARCRWHTDAVLTIREAIKERKRVSLNAVSMS